MKNLDLEIAERTKLEEELATLQVTADAATEQNEVRFCFFLFIKKVRTHLLTVNLKPLWKTES